MYSPEEGVTRQEMNDLLKEEGYKPGTEEFNQARVSRFVPIELRDSDGKQLYFDIDQCGAGRTVAATAKAT